MEKTVNKRDEKGTIKFNYSPEWYETEYHTNDYQLDIKNYEQIEHDWKQYKIRFNGVIDEIDPIVDIDSKVCLEIACHHGKTGFWLCDRFPNIKMNMFDFSKVAVEWCKKYNPYPDRCRIWQQDVTEIDVMNTLNYDFVTCLDIIEHLPKAKYYKMVSIMSNIIKKGGYALVKCGTSSHEPSHINIVPVRQILLDFKEFGFKYIDMFRDNTLLFRLDLKVN